MSKDQPIYQHGKPRSRITAAELQTYWPDVERKHVYIPSDFGFYCQRCAHDSGHPAHIQRNDPDPNT